MRKIQRKRRLKQKRERARRAQPGYILRMLPVPSGPLDVYRMLTQHQKRIACELMLEFMRLGMKTPEEGEIVGSYTYWLAKNRELKAVLEQVDGDWGNRPKESE